MNQDKLDLIIERLGRIEEKLDDINSSLNKILRNKN
jgi:uncharacterized protein (UPF0335 family)